MIKNEFYITTDCIPFSEHKSLSGEILVLKPKFLLSPYDIPEYQLTLCVAGEGNRLFIEFIRDDAATADYIREDFLGILKPWLLPEWAYRRMQDRERCVRAKMKKAALTAQLTDAPKNEYRIINIDKEAK